MNKNQLASLRTSIAEIAAADEDASALFYRLLFERHPELQPLFPNQMGGQSKRLMQMMDTAVFALDQPAMLVPLLKQLGQRHVGYGVLPEHYPLIGEAFLAAVAITMGERFTPEVKAAWEAFYAMAAEVMLDGAKEPVEPPLWERRTG